jgi:hypothetical protein
MAVTPTGHTERRGPNWGLNALMLGLASLFGTQEGYAQEGLQRAGKIFSGFGQDDALEAELASLIVRQQELVARTRRAEERTKELVERRTRILADLERLQPPACALHEKHVWNDGYRCVEDLTSGDGSAVSSGCEDLVETEVRPCPSGAGEATYQRVRSCGTGYFTDWAIIAGACQDCSPDRLAAAQAEMVKLISVSREEVARACIDTVTPSVEDSYPENSTNAMVRFMNTCGNRWCVRQGYFTGRMVEYFNKNGLAECRHLTPPPSVPAACVKQLASMGVPIERIETTALDIATGCIDPLNTTVERQLPHASPEANVRFVTTCGNRACQAKGFASGRVIEHHAGKATLECYREGVAISDPEGNPTRVQNFSTTVNAVANACIDDVNPMLADNLPTSAGKQMRFVNTCGNRYCKTVKNFQTGKIVEYLDDYALAQCTK